jgi:hypothetical protein
MINETWKQIPNFDNYLVSDFGRVKSLIKHNGTNERIMCGGNDGKGYLKVGLMKDGKRIGFRIHQLVAMAFLDYKPNKTMEVCVDHINNDKKDNRLKNLQLVSNRLNASKDRKGGSSKYVGVHWSNCKNRWISQIRFSKGKSKYLGSFRNEEDAAKAYMEELYKMNNGNI